MWYLAPIFLGILGGIVMYLVIKDDDPKMAKTNHSLIKISVMFNSSGKIFLI